MAKTFRINLILFAAAAASLAAGGAAPLAGAPEWTNWIWIGGIVPVLCALLVNVARGLGRGELGVDVIALLAMGGALILGENLAGIVIALMFASGQALEEYAQARARREMSALLDRAPRTANRYGESGLSQIPLAEVRRGDRLLVRTGDVVPVDGMVVGAAAVLDESALTGEPLPVSRDPGSQIRSGTTNAGTPFDLVATATSADSTYAGIVRMVQAAQESKAPSSRLADRYALLFVPLALVVAAVAYIVSGDLTRALAVLVVATPCPLILAVPVAIVSGISRCAKRGALVKGAAALEMLAKAKILLFDKTGTLTGGNARLITMEASEEVGPAELLRLAASLDQASQHVIAEAIVTAARNRKLTLAIPSEVHERPGAGLEGLVDGKRVAVGSFAYISERVPPAPWCGRFLQRMGYEGAAGVFVAVDGVMAGAMLLADEIRPDTPRALRLLRKAGVERVVMVTGDRTDVAETIGAALGVDQVLAEQTPEGKVAAIAAAHESGTTIMVGDGINDAPALAAADVGVAMGARGTAASSEAGDVVLLVDRLDRLAEALHIARRSRAIAVQSVIAGMGLSFIAMAAAASGYLPPVAGALVQEAIDVAVILNSLRALGGHGLRQRARALPRAEVARLKSEHDELAPILDRVRASADRLATLPAAAVRADLAALDRLFADQLLPHERQDDANIYPGVAQLLGGDDPMATMSRSHREILHLGRLFGHMAADLPPDGPDASGLQDFQRVLYGLEAILRLHFAQEEETYHALAADE